MTETATKTINRLLRRLNDELGLDRSFVRKQIIPEWWDDSLAANPTALAEVFGHISRHTGILLESLSDEGIPLSFPDSKLRYYKSEKLTYQDVNLAGSLASGVAALVASAMDKPYSPIPNDFNGIREEILSKGSPWVSFESLVSWCWDHGIAVVPMTLFPRRTKKMQGLISFIAPNPVIILADGHRFHSWLLFHLAHEIGHLALGHVGEGDRLIDSEIKQITEDSFQSQEDDEKAATAFGAGIIAGEERPKYRSNRRLTAREVADEATRLGTLQRTDPGFIALNYSWHSGFFPVGMGALKHIEGENNAQSFLQKELLSHLAIDRVPQEIIEYITRATENSSGSSNR